MRKQQGVRRLGPGKYQVTVVRTHPTERRPDGRPLKVKRKRIVQGFAEGRRKGTRAARRGAGNGTRVAGTAPAPGDPYRTYARQWIELRARKLKRSTMVKYVKDLEKYILPVLGGRKLDEIRPSDIRAMLAKDPGAPISRKNRVRSALGHRQGCIRRRLDRAGFLPTRERQGALGVFRGAAELAHASATRTVAYPLR